MHLQAVRLRGDCAQRRLSRQQGRIAKQALRGLRPGGELAASLGKELGRRDEPLGGQWNFDADDRESFGAAKQYALGGVQTADQVADVRAWLLGEGAARLTGQVIAADGGFTTVRPLVK